MLGLCWVSSGAVAGGSLGARWLERAEEEQSLQGLSPEMGIRGLGLEGWEC